MEPKAQTLQQKMGFMDNDLRKPKHDELMIWLDSNIKNIVNNKFNQPISEDRWHEFKKQQTTMFTTYSNAIDADIESLNNQLNDEQYIKFFKSLNEKVPEFINRLSQIKSSINSFVFDDTPPVTPVITKINKRWEVPVMADKFTVGFIDFKADFNIPILSLDVTSKEKFKESDFVFYEPRVHFTPKLKTIYVEVKTEIPSVGELIRQINHYKTYVCGDHYILCPDQKYRNILESQGIGWIDYTG